MVGTFKIVTLSASVNEGIVDLNNDHFYDGGAVTVEGATLHCWKHGGHGDQTYLQVVENSCNLGCRLEIPRQVKKSLKIKGKTKHYQIL